MCQENSQEKGLSRIPGLALRPTTVWSHDWLPNSKANIAPISSYSFPFKRDLFVGFFWGVGLIYLLIFFLLFFWKWKKIFLDKF